jgi:hypothetical protein
VNELKEFALIALVLLLSACVQQQETPAGDIGSLSIDDETPALEELPEGTSGNSGLTGEPVDLGSPI